MILTKQSRLYNTFFDLYFSRIIRKHFHSLDFPSIKLDPNQSVLLLSNHIGWWDGIVIRHICRKVWKKQFHVMMLEENLAKLSFFTKIGAFSIRKESRSQLQSLHYANELLKDSNNLVLIFPQGKIWSQQARSIDFGNGVLRILKDSNTQVLFSAMFADYFEQPKPTLSFNFHVFSDEIQKLPEAFRCFVLSSAEKQADKSI